jgi:hypothetical protein
MEVTVIHAGEQGGHAEVITRLSRLGEKRLETPNKISTV